MSFATINFTIYSLQGLRLGIYTFRIADSMVKTNHETIMDSYENKMRFPDIYKKKI